MKDYEDLIRRLNLRVARYPAGSRSVESEARDALLELIKERDGKTEAVKKPTEKAVAKKFFPEDE